MRLCGYRQYRRMLGGLNMAWDRQSPPEVIRPSDPVIWRWMLAASIAIAVAILLFIAHSTVTIALLNEFNIWLLTAFPLVAWAFAFIIRAQSHYQALERFEFLQAEAQSAEHAWQRWGERSLAIGSSCLVLPDGITVAQLSAHSNGLPVRLGKARRIAGLPSAPNERPLFALELLMPAVLGALSGLPAEIPFRITLLTDAVPPHHQALAERCRQLCIEDLGRSTNSIVEVQDVMPFARLDEKIRAAGIECELVVVLQVQGGDRYSDGLAALLFVPQLPGSSLAENIQGHIARPMQLGLEALDQQLPLFFSTQPCTAKATGLVADADDWQSSLGEVITRGAQFGGSLLSHPRLVLETSCGIPGPCSPWLLTALALDMARRRQQPLLILVKEGGQRWISTVLPGAIA